MISARAGKPKLRITRAVKAYPDIFKVVLTSNGLNAG
jgi:hypothetical protein